MRNHPEEGERFVFSSTGSHQYIATIQHWWWVHNVVIAVMEEKGNLLIFHLEMQNY